MSANSNSNDCFKLIENWIQECSTKHPNCAMQVPPRLPARVIDVGLGGETPKLYVTRNEESQYVTLSHCWGRFQTIKTTKETIEKMKSGIEWYDLSKTFQDAITVTRKLGQRYLWIDSLCIVQDDEEDWQRESAKMAQIYCNSFLTLAATRSIDGNGGCFSERATNCEELSDTLDDPQGDHLSGIYVRCQLPSHNLISQYGSDWSRCPLHYRAWAFQERLLANRIVLYMHDELRWECKTTTTCECGGFDTDNRQMFGQSNFKAYYEASKAGTQTTMRKSWIRIVEWFTLLQLSFESDRLPALSGVAQDLQSDKTGAYLAGLWENFLPGALLWRTVCDAARPTEYRAPSWSWASLEKQSISSQGLSFTDRTSNTELGENGGDEIYVKVLDVQCKPVGSNPMGHVRDGYLKISGPTKHYNRLPEFPWGSSVIMSFDIPNCSDHGLGFDFLKVGTFCWPESPRRLTMSLVLVHSQRVKSAFERVGLLEHEFVEDVELFYEGSEETALMLV